MLGCAGRMLSLAQLRPSYYRISSLRLVQLLDQAHDFPPVHFNIPRGSVHDVLYSIASTQRISDPSASGKSGSSGTAGQNCCL